MAFEQELRKRKGTASSVGDVDEQHRPLTKNHSRDNSENRENTPPPLYVYDTTGIPLGPQGLPLVECKTK